jgi:hypothetical protein
MSDKPKIIAFAPEVASLTEHRHSATTCPATTSTYQTVYVVDYNDKSSDPETKNVDGVEFDIFKKRELKSRKQRGVLIIKYLPYLVREDGVNLLPVKNTSAIPGEPVDFYYSGKTLKYYRFQAIRREDTEKSGILIISNPIFVASADEK